MNKDKILHILNTYNVTDIKDLLFAYLNLYPEEFNTIDILDLIDDLDIMYLRPRVLNDGRAKFVANERAGYLKRYLEGTMYSSREVAEQYVDIQIENAEAIIDACKEKGEII